METRSSRCCTIESTSTSLVYLKRTVLSNVTGLSSSWLGRCVREVASRTIHRLGYRYWAIEKKTTTRNKQRKKPHKKHPLSHLTWSYLCPLVVLQGSGAFCSDINLGVLCTHQGIGSAIALFHGGWSSKATCTLLNGHSSPV